MPVTNVTKDPENLTMTVVADFAAPLQRVWDAYTDPRQIEKFWGPPELPGDVHPPRCVPRRFVRLLHDRPGRLHPRWLLGVDRCEGPRGPQTLRSFEVKDGFAKPDGTPNTEMPTGRMVFHFEPTDTGSRVIVTSFHNSADDFAMVVEMGQEEGMREAMGQIDDVLADLASFAHGVGTKTDILSDTQVRISRVIRGSVEDVWRAHHEPGTAASSGCSGPDGWTMPVCETSTEVGGHATATSGTSDGDPTSGSASPAKCWRSIPRIGASRTERFHGDTGRIPRARTDDERAHAHAAGVRDADVGRHHLPERRGPRHRPRHRHDRWHGDQLRPLGGHPRLTHRPTARVPMLGPWEPCPTTSASPPPSRMWTLS